MYVGQDKYEDEEDADATTSAHNDYADDVNSDYDDEEKHYLYHVLSTTMMDFVIDNIHFMVFIFYVDVFVEEI